jgi:hypothetical protein
LRLVLIKQAQTEVYATFLVHKRPE